MEDELLSRNAEYNFINLVSCEMVISIG